MGTTPGSFMGAIEFLLLFARGGSTAIPICATEPVHRP